jgi:hypothetical protein
MRTKSRGLVQHGCPSGWLEDSDPAVLAGGRRGKDAKKYIGPSLLTPPNSHQIPVNGVEILNDKDVCVYSPTLLFTSCVEVKKNLDITKRTSEH